MEGWSHDLDTLAQSQQWIDGATPDTAFVEFAANTFNPYQHRILDTLEVPLAQFTGDGDCVRRDWEGNCTAYWASAGGLERILNKFAYAPVGNRLVVAISYQVTRWVTFGAWEPCPGPADTLPMSCRDRTYREVSERSEIRSIDLTTGRDSSLWTVPGQVYWLGVSEDGGQIVTGEGVLTSEWTWHINENNLDVQTWSNPGTVTGCGVHYRSPATGAELRPAISTTAGCTYFTRGNGNLAPVAAIK